MVKLILSSLHKAIYCLDLLLFLISNRMQPPPKQWANNDTRFSSPSIEFVIMLQQSVLESKAILDLQHQRAGCTCSTKSPCQCCDENAATNKTKIAFRGRSFCSFPRITHSLAHLLSWEWGLSNVLWQTRPGSTGCSKSRHVCVVPANSPTTTPSPISCRSPCSRQCIALSLAHVMHQDSESISQIAIKGRYDTCSTKSQFQSGDKNAANKAKIVFRGHSFCSFSRITHSLLTFCVESED